MKSMLGKVILNDLEHGKLIVGKRLVTLDERQAETRQDSTYVAMFVLY